MNGNSKLRAGLTPLAVFVTVFALVFFFIVIAATVITFILPEVYASTARIKIERVVPVEPRNLQASYDPYYIQTEFEVIQSELILNPVVQELDLNSVWGRKYQNGERLIDFRISNATVWRQPEKRCLYETSRIAWHVGSAPSQAGRFLEAKSLVA